MDDFKSAAIAAYHRRVSEEASTKEVLGWLEQSSKLEVASEAIGGRLGKVDGKHEDWITLESGSVAIASVHGLDFWVFVGDSANPMYKYDHRVRLVMGSDGDGRVVSQMSINSLADLGDALLHGEVDPISADEALDVARVHSESRRPFVRRGTAGDRLAAALLNFLDESVGPEWREPTE